MLHTHIIYIYIYIIIYLYLPTLWQNIEVLNHTKVDPVTQFSLVFGAQHLAVNVADEEGQEAVKLLLGLGAARVTQGKRLQFLLLKMMV